MSLGRHPLGELWDEGDHAGCAVTLMQGKFQGASSYH